MERASLRPVPQRPASPVEPAEALAHVESVLPDLDAAAREALALAELVGRPRPQLAAETGRADEEVAAALARARKTLRRAAFPLPGTGWCERAERLLSDELDGVLADPGPRRLAAHLANCDRCVEHERRLWQARDQLVAGFDEARAAAVPAPQPVPAVVDIPDPEPLELPDPQPEPELPYAQPEPELRLVEAPAAELPTPVPGTPPPPAVPGTEVPGTPPPRAVPDTEVPGTEPVAAAPAVEDAVASALPEPRFSLAGAAWTASLTVAVLLALVSVALTVYAIAGGSI